MVRSSPGPCPICGAAHTACTAESGPIVVAQVPARDALPPVELVVERDPSVTVATDAYLRATHAPKARR